jgi:hypothetical protein
VKKKKKKNWLREREKCFCRERVLQEEHLCTTSREEEDLADQQRGGGEEQQLEVMMTVGESGSNMVDANMKINGALQQQEEQQLDLMKVNYGLKNGLPVEAGENKAEHEDLETKIGSTEMMDDEKLTMVRILSVSHNRRALLSAVPTLTLGIMGG